MSDVPPTTDRLRSLGLGLIFLALLLAKAYFMRLLVLPDGDALRAVWTEGPFLLGVLLLVDWFFADMRLKAFFVTDLVFSAVMCAATIYASYYGQLPTPEALSMAGQATTVGDSITALLRPVYLLFLADLVLVPAVAFALRVVRSRAGESEGAKPAFVMQSRAVYAALVPALVAVVWGLVIVRGLPVPVDGLAASKARGVFTYLASSLMPRKAPPVSKVDLDDPAAVQRTIDSLRGGAAGVRIADFDRGAFSGKNVIVIQVEALQRAAVGARVGGQPVTPNLDRFIERSWYFPNTFSQVGRGTTADAETISNSSLYPSQRAASSLVYAKSAIPSLPRLVAKQDYDSLTFHTNEATYWNRSQLYPALGFTRYFDRSFFGDEDVIAFGASDQVLFTKALPELQKRAEQGTPFYAQLVTMSSHYPFTQIPAAKRSLNLEPPYAGTMTGDYLSAVEYTDRQIGAFLGELERSGLMDESIIVIYGDHFGLDAQPKTREDEAAQRALIGHDKTPVDHMNIPLIVHVPGQTAGRTVDDTVGQIDLMPTIADALGLDLSSTPHFGRSVFERAPVLMAAGGFMPPGSYMDERALFVPGMAFEDGVAYRLSTHRKVDVVRIAARLKWDRMRRLIALSDAYATHLPARADYDPDAQVIVPDE